MKIATGARTGPAVTATILSGLMCARTCDAQTVRWINPAGGDFAQAANWDAGHAPGPTDTAAFGPDGAYTVSLGANTTVQNLRVDQGSPSIDLGGFALTVGASFGSGSFNVVGSPQASPTLRLLHGTVRGAGGVTAPPGTTATLIIESAAAVVFPNFNVGTDGGGNASIVVRGLLSDGGIHGGVQIAQGSLLHVEGSVGALFLNSGGSVEVIGGSVYCDGFGIQSTGSLLVTNGGLIRAQNRDVSSQGPITVTGGATLDVGSGRTYMDCEILVDGPGSQIMGIIGGTSTRLTLRNGAALHASFQASFAGDPRIFVGGGCPFSTGTELTLGGGVLHLEQPIAIAVGGEFRSANAATLELALDGADVPSQPLVACVRAYLGATLRPLFSHPNNLRVGDQVELVRGTGLLGTTFSALDYQPLGGGRQLQLAYTDHSAFLQVVAGGSPCWTTDFNGDGDYGTDADIEAFFACIAGNCCATCASADFNGDGEIVDSDIESFFSVLAGGAC